MNWGDPKIDVKDMIDHGPMKRGGPKAPASLVRGRVIATWSKLLTLRRGEKAQVDARAIQRAQSACVRAFVKKFDDAPFKVDALITGVRFDVIDTDVRMIVCVHTVPEREFKFERFAEFVTPIGMPVMRDQWEPQQERDDDDEAENDDE